MTRRTRSRSKRKVSRKTKKVKRSKRKVSRKTKRKQRGGGTFNVNDSLLKDIFIVKENGRSPMYIKVGKSEDESFNVKILPKAWRDRYEHLATSPKVEATSPKVKATSPKVKAKVQGGVAQQVRAISPLFDGALDMRTTSPTA